MRPRGTHLFREMSYRCSGRLWADDGIIGLTGAPRPDRQPLRTSSAFASTFFRSLLDSFPTLACCAARAFAFFAWAASSIGYLCSGRVN